MAQPEKYVNDRAQNRLSALADDRACEAELAGARDDALKAGRLPDLDMSGRRFAFNSAAIPDITVERAPLTLDDKTGVTGC